MDETTFRAVHATMDPNPPSWRDLYEDQEKELRALKARVDALELVASYAKDVLDFWPVMTLRTIRVMIPKMASLKEALEFLRGQDRS